MTAGLDYVRRTGLAGIGRGREFSLEWGDQSRIRALVAWFVRVDSADAIERSGARRESTITTESAMSVSALGPDFAAISAIQVLYDTNDGVQMTLPIVGRIHRTGDGTPVDPDGVILLLGDEVINGIYGYHGGGHVNSIGLVTQYGRRELLGTRAGTPFEWVLAELDPVRMPDALITGLYGFQNEGGIRGVGMRCRVSGVGPIVVPWGPGQRVIPLRDVGKPPELDMTRVAAAPRERDPERDQSAAVGRPAAPSARPNPNHRRIDVRRVDQWDDVFRLHSIDGTIDEYVFVERSLHHASAQWVETYAGNGGQLRVHIGASEPWIELPTGEAFAAPAVPLPAVGEAPMWDNAFVLDGRVDYLAWATRGLDISRLNPFDFQASDGALQQEVFQLPLPGSGDFHIATTGKAAVVPNGWRFLGDVSGRVKSRTTSTSTDEETRRTWATSLGISADAEGFGAKIAFSKNTTAQAALSRGVSDSVETVISETVETTHVLVVDLATVELSPAFRAAAVDAALNPSVGRIADFVARFGTHFAYAITFGSKSWEQSHETKESISLGTEQGSGQKISGHAGAEGIAAGVEAARDTSQMLNTVNSRGAVLSSHGSIGSAAEPVPVLLEVRELTDLLSPTFFDDPLVFEVLRPAVNLHLQRTSEGAGFNGRHRAPASTTPATQPVSETSSPDGLSVLRACVDWPDGSSYFFGSQGEYVKWSAGAERADSPRKVMDHWRGWPKGWEDIDAAVRFPNNKAYFFKGFEYISFDIATNQASEIKNIRAGWDQKDWPEDWGLLDAVINWNNGYAYFFKGKEYLKYPLDGTKITAGPKPIAGNWIGWPSSWDAPSAAIMWPELIGNRKKAYFFREDEYIRFDVASGEKDGGPKMIRDGWPGLKRE